MSKKVKAKRIKDISFYKEKLPTKGRTYSPSKESEQLTMMRALKDLPVHQQQIALSSYQEYGQKYKFKEKPETESKIPKCMRDFFVPNASDADIATNLECIYSLAVTEAD